MDSENVGKIICTALRMNWPVAQSGLAGHTHTWMQRQCHSALKILYRFCWFFEHGWSTIKDMCSSLSFSSWVENVLLSVIDCIENESALR